MAANLSREWYVIRARGEQNWYVEPGRFTSDIAEAKVVSEDGALFLLRTLPIAVDADEVNGPWWTGLRRQGL